MFTLFDALHYVLHLYCDAPNCVGTPYAHPSDPHYLPSPSEYTGDTRAQCLTAARKQGWVLTNATAICPICSANRHRYRNAEASHLEYRPVQK